MTLEEVIIIMNWIELVIKILCIVGGIAIACIVTIPSLVNAIKARKEAKTAEEKAKADLEIQEQLKTFVVTAEANYGNLDAAMKKIGQSAGQFKKDKVLSDLRDYCDEKGYAFEKQKLSSDIDNLVALTKDVNAK